MKNNEETNSGSFQSLEKLIFLFLLSTFLIFTSAAFADDVPAAINYQGKIADSSAVAITGGYYHIEFRIWDDPTESGAGNLIWGRMFPLHVMDGGVFNVLLNDDGGEVTNPSPQTNDLRNAFSDEDRYLGLTIVQTPDGPVASPQEMQPRQQLVSAPYTFHSQHATLAEDSDRLGTIPASDYMLNSSFPGHQDPAKLVTWDGTNATAIDAHLDLDTLKLGYTVAAQGLQATNGAIIAKSGSAASDGIQFANAVSGTAASIQFADQSGTDTLSIDADSANVSISANSTATVSANDEIKIISGEDLTIECTDALVSGDVYFYDDVEVEQDATVDGTLDVKGGARILKSWENMGSVTDGGTITQTATTDGFLMVILQCREVSINIGGVSWYYSSDAQNHRNWGASCYPVAYNETWSVTYIQNNDCGEGRAPQADVYWRSMGRNH
jgi:hypothetical protein